MTDQPKIWVSNLLRDMQASRSVNYQRTDDSWVNLTRVHAYFKGERWADDWLPSFLNLERGQRLNKLPDIFIGYGGLIFMSERFADLLQEFDLGQSRLHKAELREQDRVTPTSTSLYLLNIAELKDCFLPRETEGKVVKLTETYDAGSLKSIAVRSSAAQGVDLWFATDLHKVPFFSDRLATAIKKSKMRRISFLPCKVLDPPTDFYGE